MHRYVTVTDRLAFSSNVRSTCTENQRHGELGLATCKKKIVAYILDTASGKDRFEGARREDSRRPNHTRSRSSNVKRPIICLNLDIMVHLVFGIQ